MTPSRRFPCQADRIFAILFCVLVPCVAGLALLAAHGAIPVHACDGGPLPLPPVGDALHAVLLAASLAGVSAVLVRRWPGKPVTSIYNAAALIAFMALVIHVSGGYPEAHIAVYILAPLLLYYRARWPVALAGTVFVSHHLGFFTLQELGVPVTLFSCLDRSLLFVHLGWGILQFALLGYLAGRMEAKDDYLRQAAADQDLAASVFHNAIEGIVITDADGTIVSVNPAFTAITGYSAEEAIGQTPRLLKSNRHDEKFYADMWSAIHADGQWTGQIWNRRKGGEVFLESQTIRRLYGADDVVRYVAVFSDITEQWRKDQRIEHLAFHDSLTGLANRALLMDRIRQAVALATRTGTVFSVVVLDLDRFKNINDTFGHEQGDALLQVVAQRLQSVAREIDTVARLGGDEFVLLLHGMEHPEDLAAAATRIIAGIAVPIRLDRIAVQIEASVGLAMYPTDGTDPSALLKNADAAMYDAKSAGKNTYRFFSASMTERATRRLHLEMDLRAALERREFELHFQPKVCLGSGQPVGAEALVRWRHPERGLVPPADFIPLAEETGLIDAIGKWVIDEACRQQAAWRLAGRSILPVSVNVSAWQFRRGHLVRDIRAGLERHGLDGNRLEIELTESALMHEPECAIRAMRDIRATGVRIAIDDFGTGYSSLAYLSELPLDTLKIDRSFVAGAHASSGGRAVCDAVIGLAGNLRLTVVAEGIECDSQRQYLAQAGCRLGQGYLFSRPLPAAEFCRWLDATGVPACSACESALACGVTLE